MKTWMINYFNAVCCHPLYVKSQSNHVTWTSYSLLHETKKKTEPLKRYCLSSAFREHDSRWSEMRTDAFHPFFHQHPPPPSAGNTVLRRAPKSLGSALSASISVSNDLVLFDSLDGNSAYSQIFYAKFRFFFFFFFYFAWKSSYWL